MSTISSSFDSGPPSPVGGAVSAIETPLLVSLLASHTIDRGRRQPPAPHWLSVRRSFGLVVPRTTGFVPVARSALQRHHRRDDAPERAVDDGRERRVPGHDCRGNTNEATGMR